MLDSRIVHGLLSSSRLLLSSNVDDLRILAVKKLLLIVFLLLYAFGSALGVQVLRCSLLLRLAKEGAGLVRVH